MLKTLREKAARAVAAAQQIANEMKTHQGAWPADKQASYDAALKEFTDTHAEVQRLETQEANARAIEEGARQYLQPASVVTQPAAQSGGIREAFGLYVRNGGRSVGMAKEAAAACLEVHKEAFMAYLRAGDPGLYAYAQRQNRVGPGEIHALLSSSDTLGGFLVPEDFRAEVLKADAGAAVLAPLCRTEPTSRDALVFPKVKPHASDVRRTSGFAGTWQQQGYVTGGTAPTVQNQPTFQRERIPVHSWQPDAVELSPELLEDSAANVEQIVAQAIGECLAFDKDDKILDGTGADEPEGVLQSGASTVNSQGATSIAIGGILGMYSELPSQYRGRATWIMASRTMGAILQLNTGTGGVYLFPPNQWNDTILGRPVRFVDYGMDTATAAGGTTFTASDNPVIFGDFRRYIIAQRQDLRIQRLVERFAPNVGILATARLGGQVVLTDAFRIMTVSA